MNCDGFRKGLRQTAASGGEPMGSARERVHSCPSCIAAFGGECALWFNRRGAPRRGQLGNSKGTITAPSAYCER